MYFNVMIKQQRNFWHFAFIITNIERFLSGFLRNSPTKEGYAPTVKSQETQNNGR